MLTKFQTFVKPSLARPFSVWSGIEMGPSDPILGLSELFKKDTNNKKVDLIVGAYRDENGKPWVLPSVKAADQRIINSDYNYEYLGILGNQSFIDASMKLAYGENSQLIGDKRIAAAQTLSGTGACRVGFQFIERFMGNKPVYCPNPTWPNHKNIARDSGLENRDYRYWDPKTKGLDFAGMIEDLEKAPEQSVIVLHACAHNPTGVDPTQEQWKGVLEVCRKRNHICFFDSAYQGYTSGDTNKDAWAFRLFADAGLTVLLAQSFAKNFGLYGHRVGTLSIACDNVQEKDRVNSQLKLIIRAMYSNPPLGGSRIVDTILNDPKLTQQWYGEIKVMSGRITDMRQALVDELKNLGSTHNWQHIVDQQGMFAYTGLNKDMVLELADKYAVYMIHSGRISIAGLNQNNVKYVAQGFHDVTKNKSF